MDHANDTHFSQYCLDELVAERDEAEQALADLDRRVRDLRARIRWMVVYNVDAPRQRELPLMWEVRS